MRVFLAGAQGTGKSTLVMNLPDSMGLEKRDSFSKKFLEEDPSIQTSESQKFNEFQDKILLYCLNEYVNNKNFIASRSIIDSFAYLKANDAENKVPLTNVLNHFKDYLLQENDVYIYLPIEFEISKGGNKNRDIDIEYQKTVDKHIRGYFERLQKVGGKSRFYTLTGSIESRLEKLKEIINETKKLECLK
jgi:deoxyadenosine/deoxycytidine kinase